MPYVYASTLGLFGAMYGIGQSQLIKQKCPDHALGSLFGLQSLVNGGAGTVGPTAGGAIYQASGLLPFIITAVSSTITALLFFLLPKDLPDTGPKARLTRTKGTILNLGRPIYNDHTFCAQLLANTEIVFLDPDVEMVYEDLFPDAAEGQVTTTRSEPGKLPNFSAMKSKMARSRLPQVASLPSNLSNLSPIDNGDLSDLSSSETSSQDSRSMIC